MTPRVETRIPSHTKAANITSPNLRTKTFDPIKHDYLSKPIDKIYTTNTNKYISRLSTNEKPFESLSNLNHRKVQTSMYDLVKNDPSLSRSKYHLPSASAHASQEQRETQARKCCTPIKEAYDVDLTKSINLNRYLKEFSPVSFSNQPPVKSYEELYKQTAETTEKFTQQVDKDKNLLSANTNKKNIDKPMFRDQVARKSESKCQHKNNGDTENGSYKRQSTEEKHLKNKIKETYIAKESSEKKYLPCPTVQNAEKSQNEKNEKCLETTTNNNTKNKYIDQYKHHSIKPTSTQNTSNNYYKRYIEESEKYTISSGVSQYRPQPLKNNEIKNNNRLFTNNVAEKVGKFENQVNGVTRASVTWKKHYNSERRRWRNKERFDDASTPTQHCPTHPIFGKDPKRYLSANLSTSTYKKRQGEETENSEDMIKEAQGSLNQYKGSKEAMEKTLPAIQRRYTPREIKMARSIFQNISDTKREERSKLIGYGKPRIERPLTVGQI